MADWSEEIQEESTFSVGLKEPTITITEDTTDNCNDVIDENSILCDQSAILCVIHKNGRMAAAYYRIYEKMLYILNEIIDLPPEYTVTRSLLREINAHHMVTIGTTQDHFTKALINMVVNQGAAHTTMETEESKTIPNNVSLLSFKDCTYNICEYKVKSMRLQSEPEGLSESEHELYLHSVINFQSKLSVYALGMLLKFLENSWARLRGGDDQALTFYHINQIALQDHVFIDRTTFNALQIFQVKAHDASFKHGRLSSAREGVSLYRLFSQHCKSKPGYSELKYA